MLIIFIVSACEYEADSIYHPTIENKPIVEIETEYESTDDQVTIRGTIVTSSLEENNDKRKPELLRYGHIWGHVGSNTNCLLSFDNNNYINFSSYEYDGIPDRNIEFDTEISKSIIEDDFTVVAYAINEAGISYSNCVDVFAEVYFAGYEIVEEENNDNKINPGEELKLRFFISNASSIKSQGTSILEVNEFSGFLDYMEPRRNIEVMPSNIEKSAISSMEVFTRVTTNARGFIEFEIKAIDSKGRITSLRQEDGSLIRIDIN